MDKNRFREIFSRNRNNSFYQTNPFYSVYIACLEIHEENSVVYRIFCTNGNAVSYTSDEVDVESALTRFEELESLVSLSDALFSWIEG